MTAFDPQRARRAALGALALGALVVAGGAWRMVHARAEATDLRFQAEARQKRLSEARRTAGDLPKGPKPAALDRSRAVSRLRAALGAQKGFSVEEFQASTEETPYLTTYATDNKDPGWMQVPVRILLKGRSAALVGAVAKLRDLDVPFEIDTMELTRQSSDNTGMSTVSAQIGLRVLVYRGEG